MTLTNAVAHRIFLAFQRIYEAEDRDRVTLNMVLPDRLIKAAQRIMKNRFGRTRDLRFAPNTQDEIAREVRIWIRDNRVKSCGSLECGEMAESNYRFCEKHRCEINEIAPVVY